MVMETNLCIERTSVGFNKEEFSLVLQQWFLVHGMMVFFMWLT